jgi:hypothetical protein
MFQVFHPNVIKVYLVLHILQWDPCTVAPTAVAEVLPWVIVRAL